MRDAVIVLTEPPFSEEGSRAIQQLVQNVGMLTGVVDSPADLTLKDVAVIQAATSDLGSAMSTADRISDVKNGIREMTYIEMVGILVKKSDWQSAQKMVAAIRKHRAATFEVYRQVARAQAKSGNGTAALDWARQQLLPFATVNALLGVAEGMMDHAEIEEMRHVVYP